MGQEDVRRVTVVGEVPVQGAIVLFDDLEGLFKWGTAGAGDGAATKVTTKAFRGSASMKLTTDSGTPAAAQSVNASLNTFILPPQVYEVSCVFQIDDTSVATEFEILVYVNTGSELYKWGVRWDGVNGQLDARTANGSWTAIAGSDTTLADDSWHFLSYSFDFLNKKYVDAILNRDKFDISALGYTPDVDANPQTVSVFPFLRTSDAQQLTAHVDDILIATRIT